MSPNHKNNGVSEQILNILRFVFQIFMLIFKKIIGIWKNLPKKLRLVIGIVLAGILLFSLITCDAFKGEKIDWANIRLGSVLPEPQSNRMEVWSNSSKDLDVEIYNISNNEYYEYARWCEEDKGFNIDVENYNTSFSAYNYDGYYLSLYYTDYNEKLKIRVNTPREMSNFSLPEYALDAGLPCPKSQLGCYNWKNEDEFFLYVGNTTQEEYFEYKECCVDAGFKYDIYEYATNYSAENEQGYKITLAYEDYYTFSVKFTCPDEVKMTPSPESSPIIKDEDNQESMTQGETTKADEIGTPISAPTSTPVPTPTPTLAPSPTPTLTPEPVVQENININNNKEFAALMKIEDQTDEKTIKKYVNAHIGDIVEFDGCVAFMMTHKDYKTRFDICMAGGDYSASKVYGPLFAFENVNFYDMNVAGSDSVAAGMNFRITAEIIGYSDEGGYIILEPISMEIR